MEARYCSEVHPMRLSGFALLLLFALPLRAETEPAEEAAIQYLLNQVEQSPCQFVRNGKAYDGEDARAHIERKYRYILGKGHTLNAEAFIEHAASESSFTGRDYQIQCPQQPAEPSADWLNRQLQQYRAAHP
ncbi:DUF5329 domain-containing protein [Ferrimonas balearica]|uniref:DUF5329 domain-containing protein n=1 Tax=Ferrimonas balearica TaxID=44012 RepID=UPI001C5660A9|nr:DUF5329 domain-containing protein [Ferrimonas balearica]MBW3138839.1 DUF5329 domain-containing protein [Ferrimonas balearica]